MITSFKRTTPDLLPRPQFMVLQHHRVPSTLLEVQLGQKVVDKRDHGSWLSNFTEFLQYFWRSNSDKEQWIKETMVHGSPTLQSSFNTTGSPTRIKNNVQNGNSWLSNITEFFQHTWKSNSDKGRWTEWYLTNNYKTSYQDVIKRVFHLKSLNYQRTIDLAAILRKYSIIMKEMCLFC